MGQGAYSSTVLPFLSLPIAPSRLPTSKHGWDLLVRMGFPCGASDKKKNPPANAGDLRGQWRRCKRLGSDPSVRKILWSRKWKPTPEFMDRGDWQATVNGVAKTQPQLSTRYQGEQWSLSHTRGKVILGLSFRPLKSTLNLLHRIFEKRKWEKITKGVWHNAYQRVERGSSVVVTCST